MDVQRILNTHLQSGRLDLLFADLDTSITILEQEMFSSDDILRKEHLPNLQKLYKIYEALRRQTELPENRPFFQLQITTYNAPEDIKRLLLSLRDELLYFSFPVQHISVIIIDDSDTNDALTENRFICTDSFPWPFQIYYYGPEEQKTLISEHQEETHTPLATILKGINKSEKEFHSPHRTDFGHKNVSGAMNTAFLASRKHATEKTWTICFAEDNSLGTYVGVNKGHFEHHHAFSYFHRLVRAIETSKEMGEVDLLLGESVGDYCTPKLAWKVLHNLTKNILAAKDTLRLKNITQSFLDQFPTYDLVFNNDPYTHRSQHIEKQQGDLTHGILEFKGNTVSGTHMILSPSFIKKNPYTYHGPNRVARERFLLFVKNDPRFTMATAHSLCISHSKKAHAPEHELTRELNAHMHDEYAFIGFSYALFFCLYSEKMSFDSLDYFFTQRDIPELKEMIVQSLSEKIPFTLHDQKTAIENFITAYKDFSLLATKFSNGLLATPRTITIMRTLETAIHLLNDHMLHQKSHILPGIDLFFDTVEQMLEWNTYHTHTPVETTATI